MLKDCIGKCDEAIAENGGRMSVEAPSADSKRKFHVVIAYASSAGTEWGERLGNMW